MKIQESRAISIIHNEHFEVGDLVDVNCDLCGSHDRDTLDSEECFDIVKCSECGLVYVSPQPTRESLGRYYDSFYKDASTEESAESWEHIHSFRQVKRIIDRFKPDGRTLLDVGCGHGHFLRLMSGSGYRLTGIEPDPGVIRQAALKLKDATLINNDFMDHDFGDRFDVVTSLASLEHMMSPSGALEKAHGLLKEGGIVIVRVPYVEPYINLKRHVDLGVNMGAPRHLYDFSPDSLSRYLKKAGFSDIRVYVGSREKLEGSLFSIAGVVASKMISKVLYYITLRSYIMPYCGSIVAVGRK